MERSFIKPENTGGRLGFRKESSVMGAVKLVKRVVNLRWTMGGAKSTIC